MARSRSTRVLIESDSTVLIFHGSAVGRMNDLSSMRRTNDRRSAPFRVVPDGCFAREHSELAIGHPAAEIRVRDDAEEIAVLVDDRQMVDVILDRKSVV